MPGRIAILVAAVATSLALAGCGGGPGGATTVEGVRVLMTFDVHETEFAIAPRLIPIERFGYYGIKAINDGEETHVLAIEGPGVKKRTSRIEPGESETILVFFTKAGNFTLFCPLDGHERKGMKATARVH